ncbi:MAG: tyrosine-protein phosphatase [Planctomycetota bacterium]
MFLFFAGAAGVFATRAGPAAPIPLWIAISFAVFGVAYLGGGARLLGKRSDGRLAGWAFVLHAPFLLYVAMIWHAARGLSRERPVDRVDDRLVIGRRLLDREPQPDVECWLDLTAEFAEPASTRTRPGYRSFPILDAGVPDPNELESVLQEIGERSVFVHCAQGHGRTGLVAAILLIRRGSAAGLDDALGRLQSVRPRLRLNARQRQFVHAESK